VTEARGVPDVTAEELARLDEACFPAAERWTVAAWAGELRAADRRIGIRRVDGRLAAAATVQVVADVADLHRILVDPRYRGRRMATGLLAEMLAMAVSAGAVRVLLEVRRDNTAALALYRGAGFTAIAARADYYGPGADALVMEATLVVPPGQVGGAPRTHPDSGLPGLM